MNEFWEDDTPVIDCPVTFAAGATASSLTGATVTASAKSATGTVVDAASYTFAGDMVTAVWAAGALSAGRWKVQFKVVIGPYIQTVGDETVVVHPSN